MGFIRKMVVPLEEQESVGVKIAVVPFNDQRLSL